MVRHRLYWCHRDFCYSYTVINLAPPFILQKGVNDYLSFHSVPEQINKYSNTYFEYVATRCVVTVIMAI